MECTVTYHTCNCNKHNFPKSYITDRVGLKEFSLESTKHNESKCDTCGTYTEDIEFWLNKNHECKADIDEDIN
jgi:hypothetical protein